MEKITIENLLTTLFKYGFDKVDQILYAQVLNELSLENAKTKDFDFDLTVSVSKAITKDGSSYKLNNNRDIAIWFAYHTSEKLLEYFKEIDFEKLVIKKLEALGYNSEDYVLGNVQIDPTLFSQKEMGIINEMIARKRNAINAQIAEEDRIASTRENMMNSEDYIDWLISYAKVNNGEIFFSKEKDEDLNIGEKAYEKIKDLPIFYELIRQYSVCFERGNIAYSIIKHKDEIIHIGKYGDSSEEYFLNIASQVDEKGIPKVGHNMTYTNYSDVVNKYKKQNHPEKSIGTKE